MGAVKTELQVYGAIVEGDYFTDGRSLYYVLGIDSEEGTAHVENCDTLFSAHVPCEMIFGCWSKLDFHEEKRVRVRGVFVE
jgi:hypothetical protein